MSVLVGVTLGLLSGFLGGRVDTVLMTVVDVTLSFPPLLLALAFVAALGPSLVTIIVVLGLTGWERYARVVRAEVLALREKDFIEAARAHGGGRGPHAGPPSPAQHLLVDHRAVHPPGGPGHPAGGRALVPGRGHAAATYPTWGR